MVDLLAVCPATLLSYTVINAELFCFQLSKFLIKTNFIAISKIIFTMTTCNIYNIMLESWMFAEV
jgi:hypothetical protein